MQHRIVSRGEWIAARTALLAKEKALTRQRDALAAERRALPWVKMEKDYVFDTPEGRKTLADLFDGRSQLIVQHFMLAPDWDAGCVGCSLMADHVDAAWPHLGHHDVSFVAVARAKLGQVAAYWRRMGWNLPYASSSGSDFNYDFNVSFTDAELAAGKATYNYAETDPGISDLPGMSVFFRDEDGTIYHTWSGYARSCEEVMAVYPLLDIAPKGRNETGPHFNMTDWVKRHDEYDDAAPATACCAH